MLSDEYLENLDCMEPAELRAYSQRISDHANAEINPSTTDWQTSLSLAIYADSKARAMEFRRQGLIKYAKRWEDVCDLEYGRLPEYARW